MVLPQPPPVIYPVTFEALAATLVEAQPLFPVLALICAFVFLLWWWDEPPQSPVLAITTLGSYLCLLVIGAASTILIERKWKWRWTRVAGALLTIAVVFAWGYFDTYKTKWISGTARYTDTYGQWSGRHCDSPI